MTAIDTAIDAIGVVGAGAVGQAVATALTTCGLSRRLLVASRSLDQAAALAADLDDMRQAAACPTRPIPTTVAELAQAAAVVIAVRAPFANTRTQDVRMGGAAANAPLIRALGHTLMGYTGTVLVVTNPVDLMVRLFAETSGCRRVYGIGSNLDSARYRLTLAQLLDVPSDTVAGHVIGEHGEAAVVCASSTTVGGRSVPVPLAKIRHELRSRPGRISAGVGRTRCGPAGAVLSALRKALGLADGIEELSCGHGDAWLGIPLHFTAGQPIACLPDLNQDEQAQLAAAAAKLRTAYQALRFPHPTNSLWRGHRDDHRHPTARR